MTGRALLIGMTAPELPGVAEGVHDLGLLLAQRHDFTDIMPLLDPSGRQIRAAFGALAKKTGPEDAVVVYYAGHGSLFRTPLVGEDGHVCHPCVVASGRSGERSEAELVDFRGVLGTELSRLIRVLTHLTDNVTVILDCCNAPDMLRIEDDGLEDPVFQAAEKETQADLEEALDRQQRGDVVFRGAPGAKQGPRAVLLLASASGGKSFPDADPDMRSLLFTRGLLEILVQPGATKRAWVELIHELRRSLRQRCRAQLPSVAGARFRLPFSLVEGSPGPGFVAADVGENGTIHVDAGVFAGFHGGATMQLYAATGQLHHEVKIVGRARVLDAGVGHTLLQTSGYVKDLPKVVYIRPREHPEAGEPLFVGPGVDLALLGRDHPWLPTGGWRRARPEEAAVARVELAPDGTLLVRDHLGERVAAVERGEHARDTVAAAVERARSWWHTDTLLDRPDVCRLGDCCEVGWGVLDDQGREQALVPDAQVAAGALMFFRVANIGAFAKLYVRAYRVRVDRARVHWEDKADGTCIEARSRCHVGERSRGPSSGIELDWPDEVPRDWFRGSPAREWALLCVSTEPISRYFLDGAIAPSRGPMRSAAAMHGVFAVPYRLAP